MNSVLLAAIGLKAFRDKIFVTEKNASMTIASGAEMLIQCEIRKSKQFQSSGYGSAIFIHHLAFLLLYLQQRTLKTLRSLNQSSLGILDCQFLCLEPCETY